MRRTLAAVVTCCVFAFLLAACDQRPPERSARAPCFPQSRHVESRTAAYPPGFSDRKFDRFFRKALRVAGDRISHEGQGCVEEGRIVADLGMKSLTQTDRRRIEALAPPWVKVNLFETQHSMSELEAFGDRAMTVLEDAGVEVCSLGFYGTPGKVEIVVCGSTVGLHRFLSATIPADSFVLEEGEPAVLF